MKVNGKAAAAAFVKARAAIGATVTKDAKANYGRYATLAAVMEAITPALAANGLALVQEAQLMQDSVEMDATLVHESGETIEFVTLAMPLGNQRTAQAVGSAMSYGRRYQLTALFGLAPDDDDGEAASKTPQNGRSTPATSYPTAGAAKTQQRPATQPTAHVDDAPPVDENGPFDDVAEAMVDDTTQKRLHALGTAVYGSEWDGKRHELIEKITQGRTHSSKDLTLAEAKRMCAGIEAKLAQMQQPDAKRKAQVAA